MFVCDLFLKIFSRNSEDNTTKYPDLLGHITRSKNEGVTSCVLDAEVRVCMYLYVCVRVLQCYNPYHFALFYQCIVLNIIVLYLLSSSLPSPLFRLLLTTERGSVYSHFKFSPQESGRWKRVPQQTTKLRLFCRPLTFSISTERYFGWKSLPFSFSLVDLLVVSMCVYVCISVFACLYVCMCVFVFVFLCVCMHVCMYICMYVCICVCVKYKAIFFSLCFSLFPFDHTQSLLCESLRRRREVLRAAFHTEEGFFHFAKGMDHLENGDTLPIETFMTEACNAACEGLMVTCFCELLISSLTSAHSNLTCVCR